MIEPDKVGDLVGVAVAADHDIVANIVVYERLKGAVEVGLVPIPRVIIERVNIIVRDGLVDLGKDSLRADDAPSRASRLGSDEIRVKPMFLPRAHHGAAGIVGDVVDVVGVPVQISDPAVVMTSVEHDQVHNIAKGERPPDTQIVVHLDLTEGHPFEVGADSVHLALIGRDASIEMKEASVFSGPPRHRDTCCPKPLRGR
jgi:hypothetical protein